MILLWLHDNRCAGGTDHQHAAAGADRLIVDIDTDNGIGAQMTSLLAHFAKRDVFGLASSASYAADRPPTISRIDAKKSRKMFAPRMASPETNPKHLTAFFPSILGVVDKIIVPSR